MCAAQSKVEINRLEHLTRQSSLLDSINRHQTPQSGAWRRESEMQHFGPIEMILGIVDAGIWIHVAQLLLS